MKRIKEMSDDEYAEYRRISNKIRRGKLPRWTFLRRKSGKAEGALLYPLRSKSTLWLLMSET